MSLIFLVGFMGSGKTSVGTELATQLNYKFIDLDELIVQKEKSNIYEIFAQHGENYFRQVEHNVLSSLIELKNTVISLGGGTFIQEKNQALIKHHGISIWLKCDLETILSRLTNDKSRPLNRSPKQMQALLESRLFAYQQADLHIDVTNLTVQQIVKTLAANLQNFNIIKC